MLMTWGYCVSAGAMIDLCIAVTVALTCSWWNVIILDTQEDVQLVWDLRSNAGRYGDMVPWGFTDFNKKEIILTWEDVGSFTHEWTHAWCHEYYFFHMGNNHPYCEVRPHFKVQI